MSLRYEPLKPLDGLHQPTENTMNEEQSEIYGVIELALSLLHERAQTDEDFVENILDRFDVQDAEELKELIANVFYSH